MTKIFFPWKPEYSVKIQEIDEQHKKIIDMLNRLYTAFMNKEHDQQIGKIIEELEEYTVYHFGTEEKYFYRYGFPETKEHMLKHINFTDKIKTFKEDYKQNNSSLTFQVVNFLKDWLNHHILIEDQKYVELFTKNGLK